MLFQWESHGAESLKAIPIFTSVSLLQRLLQLARNLGVVLNVLYPFSFLSILPLSTTGRLKSQNWKH
jgi:hypothetical protein